MTLSNGTTLSRAAGTVLGPIVFDTRSPGYNAAVTTLVGTARVTNPLSPYYIPLGFGFDTGNTSTYERFNNGTQIDYFQRTVGFYTPAHTNPATAVPNATSMGFALGDARFAILDRNWTSSGYGIAPPVMVNGVAGSYLSYQSPGVSNQSIYDWTTHNLNEANFGHLRSGNYNIELEQQVTDKFFVSAGWFRQDMDSSENYILSQLQGNSLLVDTNTKLMNGQPNPYAGLAYVPLGLGGGVDTFFAPETIDNYRAMVAYDLDFSQNSGFTKWFGRHRLLGLVSQQNVKRNRERWRLTYTDGDAEGRLRYGRNLTLDGQSFWNNTAMRKAFYVASPGDPTGTVTHSVGSYGNPGWESLYTSKINAYNFNTNDFHDSLVAERIAFSEAGSANFRREVKSWNLATQSYLWNDRLVATVGIRHDAYRARNTTAGAISDPNTLHPVTKLPIVVAPALTANQLYPNKDGEAVRSLFMNRYILWDELEGDTKTIGAAFRPLKGWDRVERPANEGSVVADFLRSLTLYYNQSDNFNPPPGAQTDYFRQRLPKPTGDGKDGGFGFNLFGNKLVARVNWFETANQNERTGAAGTLLTRLAYSDTTTGIPWASAVVRIRNAVARGETLASYTANTNWNDGVAYPLDDSANQQKIHDLIQLPLNYYSGITVAATQQSIAKGTEVQVTYNPTSNWTMKFTATKSKSIYTAVAPQYDEWLAERLPYWTTSAAPEIPDFVAQGREYSLKKFWTGYGFTGVALKENTNGNTSPQAYHNNVVVSEVALAKALEGAVAPNQRQYRANFLTNYAFNTGKLKGFSVGGSARWESKAAVGFMGKAGNPLAPTVINASDVSRPVYLDNGNYFTDVWTSYTRKVFNDKYRMKIQLNINNVLENGGIQPIAVNWDGLPWAYRIVDPRQIVLTTTFDF